MVLEEYESFQTYNNKMIDLVKKRYRGVYCWLTRYREFNMLVWFKKVLALIPFKESFLIVF